MGKNLFNSVPLKKVKSNAFNLSHEVKMSFNMGKLYPVLCVECLPGDRWSLSAETLIRMAPMLAPVMHRLHSCIDYYFVPNRIVWDGWEDWIAQNPGALAFPTVDITAANYYEGGDQANPVNVLNYLGVPRPNDDGSGTVTETISALSLAAYQMIYNEYYRDENLIDEVAFKLVPGDNTSNTDLYVLRHRAWQHDYFTGALPFAQKGAAVDIPLIQDFDDVPLRYSGNPVGFTYTVDGKTNGAPIDIAIPGLINADVDTNLYAKTSDLTTTATTINDLRVAVRMQEWLERNAVGGTRYKETILAHFEEYTSDGRLQRPEFICRSKAPLAISEVLNNTGTEDLPQGNMAGHGIGVNNGRMGYYKCEEWGFIIAVISILPLTAYQQGMPKHFTKYRDILQFYWPTFAHLGEQEVESRELFAFDPNGNGDAVFGYVPRYAEYKFLPSRVAGDFQTALSYWHMGRIFDPAGPTPTLNEDFINANPTNRIFSVEDPDISDPIYSYIYHNIRAIRKMPKYGTPML